MRRHALLGVLAAISCARQATAWDETCWDCSTFRASLWLPFSITTLVVVIILGAFLILQCWRWSRPEPSPLRASSAAPPPPPEPEPVAAEIVPYPNR